MGVIVFNGVSSKDLGIRVATPPEYQIPERDISTTLVPGRNGEAILNVGAFKNVKRGYSVSFPADIPFSERAATIARWLFSSSGYARLQDSYDPGVYRLAFYRDNGGIESLYQEAGRFNIEFDCRPERFLTSGDFSITFSPNGRLLNPTGMEAFPRIDVYGTGAGRLAVGDTSIEIISIPDEKITLDCESENALYGVENRNNCISAPNGFPRLRSGETMISCTGGITKIEITPRWWSI